MDFIFRQSLRLKTYNFTKKVLLLKYFPGNFRISGISQDFSTFKKTSNYQNTFRIASSSRSDQFSSPQNLYIRGRWVGADKIQNT